jgi:hypothetical protein
VHLSEITEGRWGGLGQVVRFPEIAEYVLTGAIPGVSGDRPGPNTRGVAADQRR